MKLTSEESLKETANGYGGENQDYVIEIANTALAYMALCERLQEAIDDAPHAHDCSYFRRPGSTHGPCNCWKSQALLLDVEQALKDKQEAEKGGISADPAADVDSQI